jgi:hypothetical protein
MHETMRGAKWNGKALIKELRDGGSSSHSASGSNTKESQKMKCHIVQSQAKNGDVTLRTWTDVQGSKKENFYITGVPGTAIPLWFRKVLRDKELADIIDFPNCPSRFYE